MRRHNRSVRSGCSRLLGLVVAVAVVATGCVRSGDDPVVLGTIRVAAAQPGSLDPVLASDRGGRLVVDDLYAGLVAYDATTAAVAPAVATSWDINTANTVFTFHLRPRARFSDGELVTAASFVHGITRALSPALVHAAGSLSYELAGIVGAAAVSSGATAVLSGVTAPNPSTLVIRLSSPDAGFLIRCGDTPFDPLPGAATVASPSWARDPVGDGPFALAQPWVAGQPIVLVPNRYHYGGSPKVQVDLEPFPDPVDGFAAWQAGQVDWAEVPPNDAAGVLKGKKTGVVVQFTAALDYLVVALPASTSLTPQTAAGATAFREALSLAIDRRQIAASAFGGAATPAAGIVPPLIPGSATSVVGPLPKPGGQLIDSGPCSACGFDPGQARHLLAESGVTVTATFPLYYLPGSAAGQWMPMVAEDLRANLGIDAVAEPAPSGLLGPGLSSAAVSSALPAGGALEAGRTMRYPIPDDFLETLLGSDGVANLSGYANPTFDALLGSAKASAEPGSQAAEFQRAERLALKDLPIVPLFWPTQVAVARPTKWSGLGMDAVGDPTLSGVTPKR